MDNTTRDIHHDLIEGAKQHKSSAQQALYNLYVKAMLNISFRIVNNRDEAEDVIQEAFIKVFKNIDSYRGDATFGAWIKRIVVNTSLNVLKKKKLDLVEMTESDQDIQEEETSAECGLSVAAIKSAIQRLPDGYRTVLSLYLLEGYDHKEIGKVLNVTESTSKSQYNRAKKRLKIILKENYQYER